MNEVKLTKLEASSVLLFLDLCPQWKQIISKQIQQSTLQREYGSSNYSVYFTNNLNTEKLGITAKMPVEIILGSVDVPEGNTLKHVNGHRVISPCIISIRDNNAISIRMYFNNGLLNELEIYSLSGNEIGNTMMLEKPRTYIVYDDDVLVD